MTLAEFGMYSLAGTVVLAAGGVLASVSAGRFGRDDLLPWARGSVYLLAALLTVCCAALLRAILNSDFRLEYVASYSERALPFGYKVAAFWAGQAGSLLLWGWLVSVLAAWGVWLRRKDPLAEQATLSAVLAVVVGFFALLMLFEANPFEALPHVPQDGRGMNPQLQDPAMILHPPLLFIGYAGFTVPFAYLFGAMVRGREDRRWIEKTRRWVLGSWLFLTVGIVLGAWWAYVELGWGGYWAWDPVENASLLPWITATALLHSIMAQSQRGTMKVWNFGLISLTFALCLFSTYVTRSGEIASVHAYSKSGFGSFILVFLGICLSASVAVLIIALVTDRRRVLQSERPLERMLSRDVGLQCGNVLLMVIMATTLVGTTWPLLMRLFRNKPASLGPEFYNDVVVPMTLVLLVLMGLAPLLPYGKAGPLRLRRRLILPGIAAHLTGFAVAWLAKGNVWAIVSGVLCALVGVSILQEFVRIALGSRGQAGQPTGSALARIRGNYRRIGGLTVHLGLVVLVVGVTGSSLFTREKSLRLIPGESARFGRYEIVASDFEETHGANYMAVGVSLTVVEDGGGTFVLHPQRRQYVKWQNPSTEIDLRTTWREDLYVNLSGQDDDGRIVIQARIKPLVIWVWIGACLMSLGGILSMLPRPGRRGPASPVGTRDAAAVPSAQT